MSIVKPNPYFNQTKEWSEFFIKANNPDKEESNLHAIIKLEYPLDIELYIYQYPLVGNNFFWYVPRIFYNLEEYQYTDSLKKVIKIIQEEAIKRGAIFVGFDFDSRLLDNLGLKSDITKEKIEQLTNISLVSSSKHLQYLSTPLLPVDNLLGNSNQDVSTFYNVNEKGLFARANQPCRRHTRRAMAKGWTYEFNKSSQIFEEFWKIWEETAIRQNFNLHKKNYIKTLLEYDWVELLIIRDSQGIIQGGWIELLINDSLINIYGANTQKSLTDYGQYYSHIVALQYIKKLQEAGKQINIYDMGGSDDAGYGLFKRSYRPDYLNFVGQYNLVIKPLIYNTYFIFRELRGKLKIK